MVGRLALESLPPRLNDLMSGGHWSHGHRKKQEFYHDLAVAAVDWGIVPVAGPARLEIVFGDARRDWDAGLKALCDGLEQIQAVENDSQFQVAQVVRVPKRLMDPAVLMRWGPVVPWTTADIEAWWGGQVRARGPRGGLR